MLSVLRHYNIIPVFVFDGKPPAEKKALIQKRKDDKVTAELEYTKLKEQLRHAEDDHDKQEILNNIDLLKRNFIHISKAKIQEVKNLIRSYGATYYDAPGEADELCAFLAITNKVWGCLSEDMDMFVYGCPRVFRYLSLLNHTVILYDLNKMLDNLGITQTELREICVLSGTDYNFDVDDGNKRTLYQTLKLFKKFIKSRTKHDLQFYEWLKENTKYIDDIDLLNKIKSMFDFTVNDNLNVFETVDISNGPICKTEIKTILQGDGFIFPAK
jgi:flap endonuclease-1